MKTIFIDVETTGKADFALSPDNDRQPRIVQLAAILCDNEGKEVSSLNLIIKPRVNIPAEAAAIHGITNERAMEFGVTFFNASYLVQNLIKQSDLVVAHNLDFDWFVLSGEFTREVTDLPVKLKYCTMRKMVNICKLPSKYPGEYKWPRLIEAYRHAFGKDFTGAHDALADVRACKEIYFWLKVQTPVIPPAYKAPVTVTRLADEMRKAAG